MDHRIEPGRKKRQGGRKLGCRDFPGCAPAHLNTSLMTALRKGMLARSSVVGSWRFGHTEFTSLYSRSWATGSFAKWYSAHESVLDVWQEVGEEPRRADCLEMCA